MAYKKSQNIRFIVGEAPNSRRLVCPFCSELLQPADLEAYSACPFCGNTIERTGEVEDFIIEPMVQHWLNRSGATPSGNDSNR